MIFYFNAKSIWSDEPESSGDNPCQISCLVLLSESIETKWCEMYFPPILGKHSPQGIKQAGLCGDYQLRHSGVVLRIEMVLLRSHCLKTATDGHPAKAVLGGHGWCPGKTRASGWKEGEMRIDSRWGWGCFMLGWVCNPTNGGLAACHSAAELVKRVLLQEERGLFRGHNLADWWPLLSKTIPPLPTQAHSSNRDREGRVFPPIQLSC